VDLGRIVISMDRQSKAEFSRIYSDLEEELDPTSIYPFCAVFLDLEIVSLYKGYVLIACSAIAGYIGITYSLNNIIRRLYWFLVVIITFSYILAVLFPAMGTQIGYPYYGAWRGLFSHKNSLGAFISLGTSIFMVIVLSKENKPIIRLSSMCLFLSAAGLLFLSRSAAGILIFVILNSGLLLGFAWVKWNKYLRTIHYFVVGILFTGAIILALSHLNFIFGLLNRNTTLTGRLPLWYFLITSGISNHPFIGNGFGATWVNEQFRMATQAAIGWDFAPITAHNGLLDIFLCLGLVGVVLLISVVLVGLYRVTKYALKEQTFISLFPLLMIGFVILTNISETFLLELESFTWFLLVCALFSTTPLSKTAKQI
jgi:exopolysaccharide production protein ExoQ